MYKTWKKQDTYVVEKHPFDNFLYPGIKYLIIGTFPTHKKNLRYDFFYSGEENLFWEIIEIIFDHSFQFHSKPEAIEERQRFFKDKGIGFTDMHEMCYRRNNLSTDENLFSIVLRDIFHLLDQYPAIEKLILTSRGEVFGALGLLKTYFLQRQKEFPKITKRNDKILEGELLFENRRIKIVVPYSPSSRLIKNKKTTQKELTQMYKSCLL